MNFSTKSFVRSSSSSSSCFKAGCIIILLIFWMVHAGMFRSLRIVDIVICGANVECMVFQKLRILIDNSQLDSLIGQSR